VGHIRYGSETFEFTDLVLTHLHMVVSTKLRRGESFFFTWQVPAFMGSGRHSLWIDNSVPLQFVYSKQVRPALDMAWMERALADAASTAGLHLPEAEPFSMDASTPPL